MGSRSRRRKKLRELDNLGTIAPKTERMRKVGEYQNKRVRAEETKRATKPDWVVKLESSGYQPIGGGKPGTSPRGLTNAERRENRRVWKARKAKVNGRDDGTGKQVRPESVYKVGGDYGHMIGDAPIPATREQMEKAVGQNRYKAHAQRMETRQGPAKPNHGARHTHTGDCLLGDECVRNDRTTPAPNDQRVNPVGSDKPRVSKGDVRKVQARDLQGGKGVSAPKHTMDSRGNIVHGRLT